MSGWVPKCRRSSGVSSDEYVGEVRMAETWTAEFAKELRKWWSFDGDQQHTHSWHNREDFIDTVLPKLLGSNPEIRRLRSLVRELAVALGEHGYHAEGCCVYPQSSSSPWTSRDAMLSDKRCTCGLRAALSHWREAGGEVGT